MKSNANTHGEWADDTIYVEGANGFEHPGEISEHNDAPAACLEELIRKACEFELNRIDPRRWIRASVAMLTHEGGGPHTPHTYEVIAVMNDNHYQRFEVYIDDPYLLEWLAADTRKRQLIGQLSDELRMTANQRIHVYDDASDTLITVSITGKNRSDVKWTTGPIWQSTTNILQAFSDCRRYLESSAKEAK